MKELLIPTKTKPPVYASQTDCGLVPTSHPDIRLPVPEDLPAIMPYAMDGSDHENEPIEADHLEKFIAAIEHRADSLGIDLNAKDGIKPIIYVTYPRRPNAKGFEHVKEDRGVDVTPPYQIIEFLNHTYPHIEWIDAYQIIDVKPLDRSKEQSAEHALLNRKEFQVIKETSTPEIPLPLSTPNQAFLVMDYYHEQGTTLAELISFIQHNGGHVLAVNSRSRYKDRTHLQPAAHLSVMHKAFKAIKGKCENQADYKNAMTVPVNDFFNALDLQLQEHGISLASLTNGEWIRLATSLGQGWSFREYKNEPFSPHGGRFLKPWDMEETMAYLNKPQP